MKAIQMAEHGGPDVLQLVEPRDPQPGPGEVLIKVDARESMRDTDELD